MKRTNRENIKVGESLYIELDLQTLPLIFSDIEIRDFKCSRNEQCSGKY